MFSEYENLKFLRLDSLLIPVMVGAGIYCLFQLRLLWIVYRMKATSISALRGGLRAVNGRIVKCDDSLLTSPWTKSPCVYYRFVVSTYVEDDSLGGDLISDEKVMPFSLDDRTEQILVAPTGGKILVSENCEFTTGLVDKQTPRIKECLHRYGKDGLSLLGFERVLFYEESILKPGAEVDVLGFVDKSGEKAVLRKKLGLPLVISNLGKTEILALLALRATLGFGVITLAVVISLSVH